jgi:hypothetical protein
VCRCKWYVSRLKSTYIAVDLVVVRGHFIVSIMYLLSSSEIENQHTPHVI